MKRLWALSMALCLMAAALAGCAGSGVRGASSGAQGVTVVFIPKVTGNAFFESANEGVQRFAGEQDFQVDYIGSPEASVENQIAIVRDAIDRRVDAICISSLDPTALDEILKEAMSAGIQVTTWDSDVSGDARRIMVSQGTPDQLGKMLVEMGAKGLSGRGLDPNRDPIGYVWHYSQAAVADQNSWQVAGEAYIAAAYPNWINLNPANYYSEQNPDKAVEVGRSILWSHPEIDLIICNDSTSLPGQAQAARDMMYTAQDVTITGFASPNAMREYCAAGVVERWGLWDCQVQGALGCYMAYSLATGAQLRVGDRVDVPGIGFVEIMPNTVLDPGAYTGEDSGVVLLPDRLEFTIDNVDDYNF